MLDVTGFAAVANPSAKTLADAQIKTAETEGMLTGGAVQAINKLFELANTAFVATGSMRAPVPYMTGARWKYAMLGNWDLKHPLLTLN